MKLMGRAQHYLLPRDNRLVERSIRVRFYAELNDFLPRDRRFVSFRQPLGRQQTVKDLIEAAGVPHTEVDVVIVNGTSVPFDHRPGNDDVISVYPMFESFDIRPILRLRPQPLRDTRVVVDSNLRGLARDLRMLGFDTLFQNDFADDEIARSSASDQRLLPFVDAAGIPTTVAELNREQSWPIWLIKGSRQVTTFRRDCSSVVEQLSHSYLLRSPPWLRPKSTQRLPKRDGSGTTPEYM